MLPAHRMLNASVLAIMGEDAFLRGSVPCRVNVEHGVQITGLEDEMVSQRDVATIDSTLSPKRKDTLTHPSGNYVLDQLLQDNGVNQRWILSRA